MVENLETAAREAGSEHARFRRAAVDARRNLEEFGDLPHVERPQGGSGLETHAAHVQCSYSNLLLLAYVVMFFPFMMGSLGAKQPTLTQTQPNELAEEGAEGGAGIDGGGGGVADETSSLGAHEIGEVARGDGAGAGAGLGWVTALAAGWPFYIFVIVAAAGFRQLMALQEREAELRAQFVRDMMMIDRGQSKHARTLAIGQTFPVGTASVQTTTLEVFSRRSLRCPSSSRRASAPALRTAPAAGLMRTPKTRKRTPT